MSRFHDDLDPLAQHMIEKLYESAMGKLSAEEVEAIRTVVLRKKRIPRRLKKIISTRDWA